MEFGTFLLVAPHTAVPRSNGWCHRIQRIKYAWGTPFMNSVTVVVMCEQVVNKSWRDFENRKIGDVFACGATTKSPSNKWKSALDLARQTVDISAAYLWRLFENVPKLHYVVRVAAFRGQFGTSRFRDRSQWYLNSAQSHGIYALVKGVYHPCPYISRTSEVIVAM